MESAARWILSEKGKRKLVDPSNFVYVFQKEAAKEGRLIWQCEEYRKQLKCPGKVHTEGERIAHFGREHNHTPEAATVAIAEIRKNAAQRTADTQDSTGNVAIHALRSMRGWRWGD